MGRLSLFFRLFRVFYEELFTAEAQSSPRSENFSNQELFTPRPRRLRGVISESCFTGKPVAFSCKRLALIFLALFLASASWYDRVQAQSASLRLTWTDTSDNEDGFKIERLAAGLVDATLTVPANATSYTDSALVAGTVYCYRIEAFNSAGNSDPSNQACAMAEGAVGNTIASVSLSASPTTIKPGATTTASWSGIAAPTTTDWIGLYAPAATDTSFINWIYVSCSTTPVSSQASGSCSYPLPATLSLGNYELRLFANDGFTRLAATNGLTLTNSTLTVSATTAKAGSTVNATWSGIPAPMPKDWVALYAPGAVDTGFINWIYVSCSMTAGTARASGSCSYPLPATLAAGTYELRLFSNDGFTRLAASSSFTVTVTGTTSPSLTVSPTTAKPGTTLTTTWGGITTPAPKDWIGLYVPGAADKAFINWIYVSCSMTAGTARASGSCNYLLPATLAAGTYELRLFANDGFTRLAATSTFTVTSAGSGSQTPTLAVNPSTAKPGSTITASWSGITAPSAKDWIGLYAPSAANTTFINWVYVSCSKTAGTARASGSCSYSLPTTLSAGSYELRLLANDGFTRLATSNPLTVSTSSTSTPLVLANAVSTTNGSTTDLLPQISPEWTDYDLKVSLRSMNNNSIGVMFRYQDDRNYYRFVWNQKSRFRQLEKIQNGATTVLAKDAVSYVKGRTYQVQIMAQGATLRVFIDGAQIFSVADSTFAEGTVGLYSSSNQASFDNIVVQDLATSAVLLSEDFADGTLAGWAIVDQGRNQGPSAWSATTGTLLQTSNIDGTFALYMARGWTDYRLTTKLQSLDKGAMGVMFRYQGSNDYYRFSWDARASLRRLEKIQNGALTVLAKDTVPYVPGTNYNLEINAKGAAIDVLINDKIVFSVTNSSLTKGTVALYSSYNTGSNFDDVLVQDLATGVVLLSDNFGDGAFNGWTIVDEGMDQRPSAWSVQNGSLMQSSNIGSNGTDNLGTYALY